MSEELTTDHIEQNEYDVLLQKYNELNEKYDALVKQCDKQDVKLDILTSNLTKAKTLDKSLTSFNARFNQMFKSVNQKLDALGERANNHDSIFRENHDTIQFDDSKLKQQKQYNKKKDSSNKHK